MVRARVTGGLVLLGLSSIGFAAEHRLDAGIGYRSDYLRWNIAADLSGTASPNILSELTWRNVQSIQKTIGYQFTHQKFHARIAAAYGWIYAGKNQDSDYFGDNRTFEFSRSNNETRDDNVSDVHVALGPHFTFGPGIVTLTPLFGLSYHEQNFRITNGNQTIPNLGPFPGLDSTYQTEWRSKWLGAEVDWKIDHNVRAFFRNELHLDVRYYAKANWNLRNDFAHPVSFEHRANNGWGAVLTFGMYGPVTTRWSGRFTINYQYWESDAGVDDVYFADGTSGRTRLNEVEWRGWSFSGGAQFRF